MSEIWRPIAGYEDFYEVSSQGRVRSIDRWFVRADGRRQHRLGRVLRPVMAGGQTRSYEYVTLRHGKKRSVHVLVCEAFHGPRPGPDMEAAHSNGVSADNRAANLRWATRRENVADARAHNRYLAYPKIGVENGSSKLTDEAVREIRSAYLAGATQKELARRYAVGTTTIYNATSGKYWKHVQADPAWLAS